MVQARSDSEVWLRTTDDPRAAVVVRELPFVKESWLDEERRMLICELDPGADLGDLSEHLHNRDIRVRYLERQDPTLEDVFMKLTEGLVQ